MFSEGLDVIGRNAAVQAQLIDDILDVSRITSGKIRLNIRQVDLRLLIDAAIANVSNAAKAKSITIDTDYFDVRSIVAADADRLQQIFWNLLSNTIKFTDRGGRITTRLHASASRLVVDVIDNGRGIGRDFLPYVFDRFHQADMSSTRRQGGLGLGLSIVRELVELHGGTISVTSDGGGHGSIFTVNLPYAAVEEVDVPHQPVVLGQRVAELECSSTLEGARVLVIVDEPDARRVIQATSAQCSSEVRTLSSVADAIGILTADHAFDAVISDIGMPDEDGYSLIHRFKALLAAGRAKAVSAVALTAFTRESVRESVLQAGFDYFVTKPVSPADLLRTATEMIKTPARREP